jgi:hypothetical protein
MAPAPPTAWMSTAFRRTSETLRYQNRWLSDSKWHELVKEHYFADGKQDQAEELKFSTTSLVRAINRQWKESLDDFTTSNTTGIFRHAAKPRNSSGTRRKVTYYYVTTPGQRPKKPQVAQIFEEEDLQDEFVRKARKRKQPSDDEVEQKLLLCHNQLQKRVRLKAIRIFLATGRALRQIPCSSLSKTSLSQNASCEEFGFWATVRQRLVDG